MKYLFLVRCLFFSGMIICQSDDSLSYWSTKFRDERLSDDEKRSVGKKIRTIQHARQLAYSNNKIFNVGNVVLDSVLGRWDKRKENTYSDCNYLCNFLLNTENNRADRLRALNCIADMNTFQADSFLFANMFNVAHLINMESASTELEAFIPCWVRLYDKAPNNYTLIQPMLSNLTIEKDRDTLSYYYDIVVRMMPDPLLKSFLGFYIEAYRGDDFLVSNMVILKSFNNK